MCKTFHKESDLLERIEKRCIALSRSKDLQNIVAMPSHKETPKKLKSFIQAEVLPHLTGITTQYKPKILARLANTFLLTAKCGSAHHDIDQPMDQANIDELRTNSVIRCQCKRNNTVDATPPPNELPAFCESCSLTIHFDTDEDMKCSFCLQNMSNTQQTEGGNCRACQILWLLRLNSTAARYDHNSQCLAQQPQNPHEAQARSLL